MSRTLGVLACSVWLLLAGCDKQHYSGPIPPYIGPTCECPCEHFTLILSSDNKYLCDECDEIFLVQAGLAGNVHSLGARLVMGDDTK